MQLEKRIQAFIALGKFISQFTTKEYKTKDGITGAGVFSLIGKVSKGDNDGNNKKTQTDVCTVI